MHREPVVPPRFDDGVDMHVLADILAWAPWRTGDAAIVTRNEVVTEVVSKCRARGIWVGPKPEEGLKAILGALAGLDWVRAEYGAGTTTIAVSGAARTKQAVEGLRGDLDGLVHLALAWALPILVANGRARQDAWNRTRDILNSRPLRLAPAWRDELKNKAGLSGFSQADVTRAAMALCASRNTAEAFRQDPPLTHLRAVAHAHRIDYLNTTFLPKLHSPVDRSVTEELIAELSADVAGPVQLLRPRDRETTKDPAPRAEQVQLWNAQAQQWNGDLATEIVTAESRGAAHLKRKRLGDAAIEEIIARTSERLRASTTKALLAGTWWHIMLDQTSEYFERATPALAHDHERWEVHDERDRRVTGALDESALDASEAVRDEALAYLQTHTGQGLEWDLAVVVLDSAVALLAVSRDPADGLVARADSKARIQQRIRQLCDSLLAQADVAPTQVEAVMRRMYTCLEKAFAAGRGDIDGDAQ